MLDVSVAVAVATFIKLRSFLQRGNLRRQRGKKSKQHRSEACNMPSFRETRIALLHAHSLNYINDEEFLMLYESNTSRNPDLPYWSYETFDLDNLSDDECRNELRFFKNDIFYLREILDFPEEITCYNGLKVSGIESLCLLLKRFAYPTRFLDMMPRFGRPIPQMCMVVNQAMNLIYANWNRLLTDFNQNWLSPRNLQIFADRIHQSGAPLQNCWGFVDGTVRPVCRPGRGQRQVYNGHKKIHALKFQSVVAPNGLIANLYGPVEGRRHDSAMLARSGLLPLLQQHSVGPNGNTLCIYGDPAYPLRPRLQRPFRGAHLTQLQREWNKAMSAARVSVEWVFGDILNYYKFLDFKKNLKIHLSAVGKMYIVCAILHNARTCLYGSTTQNYFDCQPPHVSEYFS